MKETFNLLDLYACWSRQMGAKMIVYDRLWDTMKEKGFSQYRLVKYYGFSTGQLSRLKKNMHVSTHTLDFLCNILECTISDIVEYQKAEPDKEKLLYM